MPPIKKEKKIVLDDAEIKALTPAQLRKAYIALGQEYNSLNEKITCCKCGKHKAKSAFYLDVHNATGVTSACKECAYKVATNYNEKNKTTDCTKESIIEGCRLLNKPFMYKLYESSFAEVSNEATGRVKNNIWTSYIKNVQSLNQYYGMQFSDSEFSDSEETVSKESTSTTSNGDVSEDVLDMYVKNKRTVLRMLGYDPFAYEDEEDKPLLYNKLVNYFDDSLKDDGFKLEAVIEIVQTFKDIKHINDTLAQYTKQLQKDPSIIATVKALTQTKKDMVKSALDLAKDNGISENNNNRKSKGAGTLSGIIKELQEMNLREAEINTFDYETNMALEDIMTRNHQNQLKQLNPDENDWEREVIHQKSLLFKLQKERDNAVEMCRLLRLENKDLKDFLLEKGLVNENMEVVENG